MNVGPGEREVYFICSLIAPFVQAGSVRVEDGARRVSESFGYRAARVEELLRCFVSERTPRIREWPFPGEGPSVLTYACFVVGGMVAEGEMDWFEASRVVDGLTGGRVSLAVLQEKLDRGVELNRMAVLPQTFGG